MASFMTIGDFSRATRLSAKALRLYHRAGLLEPAAVDPSNRYRLYGSDQIQDARVIGHLRSLDMPVEEIRLVLQARGPQMRRDAIARHLQRMQDRLTQTQSAVSALQGLLEPETFIEIRRVPATAVLIIRETISLSSLGSWFDSTRRELLEEVDRIGVVITGPLGGLWSTELFLDERGGCALFLPVESSPRPPLPGRAQFETLPASQMAVAVHRGADDTIGQAYAALGGHVAGLGGGAPGPIRESYTDGAPMESGVTEIGWPIPEKSAP